MDESAIAQRGPVATVRLPPLSINDLTRGPFLVNQSGRFCVMGFGKGGDVRKISEYLQHATECRDMARRARPEHQQQLENMATTWEQLAESRRLKLAREGNPANAD